MHRAFLIFILVPVLMSCSGPTESADSDHPTPVTLYRQVTNTHLPQSGLGGGSMDARPVDVDDDGDLDLFVACEFCRNILLINDGTGRFANESSSRLPAAARDSEDIGMADFDEDGDLDVVFATEDDLVNELYLNDGAGTFTDASGALPVEGRSNAVLVTDLNGDGHADILFGNNGQNTAVIGDGAGAFTDETAARLPEIDDVTQDLELGDADDDGDLDLLVGNEDANRLLINDGSGVFVDESETRLPMRSGQEETREADFADVDGDGDLDILFGNVRAFVPTSNPQNRILINDGTGVYTDETDDRLPRESNRSFDIDALDVDGDGDLDLLTADAKAGAVFSETIRVYRNDGTGVFENRSADLLPIGLDGKWIDVEAGDFDLDGIADLYLASLGSPDRLLLGVRR